MNDQQQAVVTLMRQADRALSEKDRGVLAQVRDVMSAMVWAAVESKSVRVFNTTDAGRDGNDAGVLAATLRGVMLGALAGAARCGRSLGLTPAEFQVEARDEYARHELVADERPTN
jgi:hypothetical protein